jgi:hypothetical protein
MVGAVARTKTRPDAELERLFPQHPWRTPLPVRTVKRPQAPLFACRFCLYRHGLVGQDWLCWPSAAAVEAHLAVHHPAVMVCSAYVPHRAGFDPP